MWASDTARFILNSNAIPSLAVVLAVVLAAGTNTAEEGAKDGENHEKDLPPGAEADGVADEDEEPLCLCSWHQADQKKGTDMSYYRLHLHLGGSSPLELRLVTGTFSSYLHSFTESLTCKVQHSTIWECTIENTRKNLSVQIKMEK